MEPSDILVVGLDTETHLIAAGDIAPRLVCVTYDLAREGQITPTTDVKDTFRAWCNSNGDRGPQHCLPILLASWQECYARRNHLVIQNAAFDIPVIMRYCMDIIAGVQVGPTGDQATDARMARELFLLLWDVMDQNLDSELNGQGVFLHDTMHRERLYRLSTLGMTEHPNPQQGDTLAGMVNRYFALDISATKLSIDQNGRVFSAQNVDITGTPEAAASWRLRFSELDGIPSEQWPPEARKYAIEDATWARKVWEVQEGMRRDRGPGSINSASLQLYADVSLRLYSMPGFRVDQQQLAKVTEVVSKVMLKTEDGLRLNGILRPEGSVNTKILNDRVEAAWTKLGRFPMLTDRGRISHGAEALEVLVGIDPVLDLYGERETYAKIRSSFLPNLQGGHVWSNYDVLKETGRTSSYGNSDKAKRKPLYAAVNIQNVPRMDGVRECFLPPLPCPEAPKGYVMCSADYKALELCSVAQVTYSLFQFSVHREKINEGYDLHTYLGSGMARVLTPVDVGEAVDHESAYAELNRRRKLKIREDEVGADADARRVMKKNAGNWRNFAKPVGLGYPGGLGPATLVTFAKATYGVDISEDQAKQFRELWRQIYPEMPRYFDWVGRQTDPQYGSSDLYCYETQGYNRFRAATTFCAAANGKAMQSLSADGAKRSVCWLARAAGGGLPWDSPFALLSDSINLAFIHDENITAHPDDELMTERCLLQSQLMVEAMKLSMPDILIEAEPAVMRRWIKAAEPEWREDKTRGDRVLRLLDEYGMRNGVRNYADIVAEAIPNYDPSKYLVPWDDVYRKQV